MNLKTMSVNDRFRAVRKLAGAHVALEYGTGGIEGRCDDAYVLGPAKPWLDGNSTGVLVYRDSVSHKLCVVSMARVTKIELLYRPGESGGRSSAAELDSALIRRATKR